MTLKPEDREVVRSVIEWVRRPPEPEPKPAKTPPKRPSGRRTLLWRRCQLCGRPARGAYCAGHEWAYGEER